MKPKIYLAGPISGLTFGQATDWRKDVRSRFQHEVDCFSPLRAKDYLANSGVLSGQYPDWPLSTSKGILSRDAWDCRTADLILVNLLGAKAVSIGTVMEIAFAHAWARPVVCAIEPEGNPHDHPMITEAINFRTASMEEAIDVVRAVLLP